MSNVSIAKRVDVSNDVVNFLGKTTEPFTNHLEKSTKRRLGIGSILQEITKQANGTCSAVLDNCAARVAGEKPEMLSLFF